MHHVPNDTYLPNCKADRREVRREDRIGNFHGFLMVPGNFLVIFLSSPLPSRCHTYAKPMIFRTAAISLQFISLSLNEEKERRARVGREVKREIERKRGWWERILLEKGEKVYAEKLRENVAKRHKKIRMEGCVEKGE